jgi:hypothetical protein
VEPNLTALRHADLRDLLGAYALGALDAEESAAVRAHLATCDECQVELATLWAAVDALPEIIEPMDPPPALRDLIAAAIQAEPTVAPLAAPVVPVRPAVVVPPPEPIRPSQSWWSRAAPWAAAALLLLSLGLLLWNLQLRQEMATSVPETIALAPTDAAPGASGELHTLPDGETLILDVRDLPPLAPDQVYEVWLIGAEGPVPAGVFDQSTDRHAIVADRGQFEAVAITAEPGPLGSEAPTGEIVVQAPL